MSFRIYLEIARAVIVLVILFVLVSRGKPIAVTRRRGYALILAGYALVVFASVMDITDNFPSLSRFIVIGNTDIQAILEKIIGYPLGFTLIAIGFWKWLPEVSELQQTQDRLKDSLVRETELRQEIQNERNQLFTTLNSIGDGVISTDAHGVVALINPAAEEITGWTQEEASGRPIEEVFVIVDEKTGNRVDTPVKRVLETGRLVGLTNHTELISRQGTVTSIGDSGAPVKDGDGNIIGAVLVFRDVTSERELFDEKLKLQKLESIGILAGGIAHDFNNLLMGIQGNINLAAMSAELGRDAIELLNDADKAAQRAGSLTRQLLTFSKGGEPNIEHVAIGEAVRESAKFAITGSDVKCDIDIDPDLWLAQADEGQISQVVENIVINARQAMPKGGRISITMENLSSVEAEKLNFDRRKYIHIGIADTGQGIDSDYVGKIFDPYFSTKHGGSGLGLTTSYSIVKKHHGYIKVSSQAGEGTIFSVYVPAVEGKEERPSVLDRSSDHETGTMTRVMIMDDEPFIRKLLTSMLERLGYDAVQAKDGAEALSLYREALASDKKIDIVLLDLTIPGAMGGRETGEELLKIDKDITMVVVSGYSDNPILSRYREHGFAAALAKPFRANDLRRVLREAAALRT